MFTVHPEVPISFSLAITTQFIMLLWEGVNTNVSTPNIS